MFVCVLLYIKTTNEQCKTSVLAQPVSRTKAWLTACFRSRGTRKGPPRLVFGTSRGTNSLTFREPACSLQIDEADSVDEMLIVDHLHALNLYKISHLWFRLPFLRVRRFVL